MVEGIVIVCALIICILLSPFILASYMYDKVYHGGIASAPTQLNPPNQLKSNLMDFTPHDGDPPHISGMFLKPNYHKSQVLACIAFLNRHDNRHVFMYGVANDTVSLLAMIYPIKTFTLINGRRFKLPHNIDALKTVNISDITQHDDALLICTIADAKITNRLYDTIKPVAAAFEYKPTIAGKFFEYSEIYLPIWSDANDMTTWIFCGRDAPLQEYDASDYKRRMHTYKKQINATHYQQREDELCSKELQSNITDHIAVESRHNKFH